MNRINSLATLMPDFTGDIEDALEVTEHYILTGEADLSAYGDMVKTVFHMIRPEIDKAITRSRRAREAAARRREMKLASSGDSIPASATIETDMQPLATTSVKPVEPDTDNTPCHADYMTLTPKERMKLAKKSRHRARRCPGT